MRSGSRMQSQHIGRHVFRVAVLMACCTAFGLAACGRKSALDPPPTSAVPAPPTSQAQQPTDWRAPPREEAAAPSQDSRRFILDPLLN